LINPAAPNAAIPYLQAFLTSGGYNPGGTITNLADTYTAYITSVNFGEIAQQRLGLPYSPAGLITTDLVPNTNFWHINVTSTDPVLASRIANGVATVFIQENESLQLQNGQSNPATYAETAQSTAADLLKQIGVLKARAAQLITPAAIGRVLKQEELVRLDTQIADLSTAYSNLTGQSTSQASQSLNSAKLIGPAAVPMMPISTSVQRSVVFGALAGVVIGLLVAFLIEYLDYSVRSPEDVETTTGQMPLAVIGLAGRHTQARSRPQEKKAAQQADIPEVSPALYSLQNPKAPISEAFRALRTNLAFSSLDRPLRTLLVTSVMPSEGKSTVAANLAVVLAQSGKRVILIDADLRRPSLHRIFGLHNVGGFTDLLLTRGDLTGMQPTTLPNLRVMTSGPLPPNPAELLSSESIIPLIEALQEQADIVIFDSPPMGGLTDAVVLSARADATLLVVRSGSVRPTVMTKSLDALRKVGGRPLGVVLNMVNTNALGSYSYYYYYYYSSGAYGTPATEYAQAGVTNPGH
jgi:capsular exopolysaccharide synthesis family protein